jgi:hypothetical protein
VLRRTAWWAATVAALCLSTTVPVGAQAVEYAPLDARGPALGVPVAELDAALACSGPLAGAERNPILLVPGTNLDPGPNFSWNYVRAFTAMAWPHCTVTLPRHGMGDIQVAAEYVVHAIRAMADESGLRVDVVGFSQGGVLPRWALRFWPDTRDLVGDLVGLAPSNHGTLATDYLCFSSCPPSYHQQASTSAFVAALNSGTETFAGIDYTVAYTHYDEVVTPNSNDMGSSSLRGGEGAIANIALQDVCSLNLAEHLAVGSYDPVAYALTIDALTHPGPASPARIDPAVCAQLFQPGVDPTTFAADYAAYLADVARAYEESEFTTAEPPLACYVTASCGAAQTDPAPPTDLGERPSATGTPSPAPELPATGHETPALTVAAAAVLALTVRRLRRSLSQL